ncbi:MAG: outer membrane beta-barrel protein [Syntrophales bacterium]
MKIRALLVVLLFVASTTSVLAAGPYVGIAAGVSIFHDSDIDEPGGSGTVSYDTGFGLNLSGGYKFNDPIRVEFELGYKSADFNTFESDSSLKVWSYMVNAYYDIKTNSPLTPFIGLGLGLLNGDIKLEGWSKDDTEFGYQIIAGAAYKVDKNVAIDISYHFQAAASDFEVAGYNLSYKSSSIMVGLRYNF